MEGAAALGLLLGQRVPFLQQNQKGQGSENVAVRAGFQIKVSLTMKRALDLRVGLEAEKSPLQSSGC